MGLKPEIWPTNHLTVSRQLNDIGFRIILIPVLGIAIPLITQMIPSGVFSNWQLKASYIYTIGIAFIIWEGNRYLLFSLRSYFNWFNHPLRKIAVLLLVIPFYTIPVTILLLAGWYTLFMNGQLNWNTIVNTTLVILLAVVFIVHVYETVFLVKQSESDMLRNSELERARAESALEALKSQIDPHFIFNSLNTLSHLIDADPAKARLFNDTLAEVYRYILQNKSRDLVMLRDEIDFLHNFFFLLKIRFEDAMKFENQVPENCLDKFLLPPIALQLLMENAIKHNDFSKQKPLQMYVRLENKNIIFSNITCEKRTDHAMSGIGLKNLQERYKIITGQQISIIPAENAFV